MAVLIKFPARIMHSLSEGGERVKPMGAENSDNDCMSSINSKYPDYITTRRRTLTEDAGLSLPDGVRQGFLLLLEELKRYVMAKVLLISILLLILQDRKLLLQAIDLRRGGVL